MKLDTSNKNTCFDLNRTRITSPLSQISISIIEKIQNVILKTSSDQLKAGYIKDAENILQVHDFIKKLVINSNEVITACKDRLAECLSKGRIYRGIGILSFMKEQGIIKEKIVEVLTPKEIKKIVTACKDGLVKCLRKGWTDAEEIVSFIKEQEINEEEIIKKSEIIKVLMQNLNCKIIEDLFEYNCKFLSYVIKNNINEKS